MYLSTWDYNRCRLMTALERIVKEAGGRVRPAGSATISNRDIDPDRIIKVTQAGHIIFVYNGMMYAYNTSDNPFFDFTYGKTPVVNGKYSKDIYYDKDDVRVYGPDLYYGQNIADEFIKGCAKKLFDFLTKAPLSKKYVSFSRIQVGNTYDDGSHYETVRNKERFEVVWEDR